MEHLQALFDRLEANHLTINLEKCVLARSNVIFLGYKVDSEGIQPLPEKVAAIRSFPPPTTKQDVQRLLGIANFHRRFLP